MSHSSDIWLTPAQAVYFLVTGDNLAEVSRLPHDVVIGRLGRIQSASVPLSADAAPEERAAAWKKVKEGLAAAGESPCAVANKWRDYLLAAGLVAAEGRRTHSSPYESIKPVEFCDLRLASPYAENARGEIVFYDVRVSGCDLSRARQRALASDPTPVAIQPAKAYANHRREQLLSQARAASNFDPAPRRYAVFGLIYDNLWSRVCTAAEILENAYGDPDGWAYWQAWLFEPMRVAQFAKLLAVHRAAVQGTPIVSVAGLAAPVLDGFIRQVLEALRAAAHSGEQWFMNIGEPGIPVRPPDSALSVLAAQIGEDRNFAVLPRDALAWMIGNPNTRHLLPPIPAAIAASQPAAAKGSELNSAPAPGIRTNRAADAQRACEQWIGALYMRPANKDAAFEAAVVACGDRLSRKAFERAWANAAPIAWRMAGRRKGA